MKSLFQRVNELEERVFFLERELSELKQRETSFERKAQAELSQIDRVQMPQQEKQYNINASEFSNAGGFNYVGEFSNSQQFKGRKHEMDLSPQKDIDSAFDLEKSSKQKAPRPKYDETLVGKYIAGALASLLIFIGAASFVAMIWNQIGNFMRFGILLGSGLLITAVGYYLFLKSPFEKNANSSIASVVFSTGAGLVYIAILSSAIALRLFSPFVSSVMCLAWTLLLLFSYRFTGRFICIAIAYMGAFVNLGLSLEFLYRFGDLLFLFFFITSVNVFMLYVTQKKRDREFQVCIFLAGFLYIAYLYVTRNKGIEQTVFEIAALIFLFGLKNLFFHLSNAKLQENNAEMDYFRLKSRMTFFQLLFSIGFFSAFFWCNWSSYLKDYQTSLILLAVFAAQFLINANYYKHTNLMLNGFYTLVCYIAIAAFTGDLFKVSSGAIAVSLFILSKRLWKNEYSLRFLLSILVIDSSWLLYQNEPFMYVFCVINLAFFVYLLKDKERTTDALTTFLSLALLYLNAHIIAEGAMVHFDHIAYKYQFEYRFVISHVLSVIFLILSIKSDLIPYQQASEDSGLKIMKYQVKYDNSLLHIFLLLLYAEGLVRLQDVDMVSVKFIFSLSTLAVMLMQSYFMAGGGRKLSNMEGAWIVIKYLLFTWTVMKSFLQLPFESLAYSIAGLVIAVIAIYMGFYICVKSIRQFGLAITILMVAKYIFVDLSGENSITRVIAFVVGGVLCFVVSVIYNKLSVKKRGSDEEDQSV